MSFKVHCFSLSTAVCLMKWARAKIEKPPSKFLISSFFTNIPYFSASILPSLVYTSISLESFCGVVPTITRREKKYLTRSLPFSDPFPKTNPIGIQIIFFLPTPPLFYHVYSPFFLSTNCLFLKQQTFTSSGIRQKDTKARASILLKFM